MMHSGHIHGIPVSAVGARGFHALCVISAMLIILVSGTPLQAKVPQEEKTGYLGLQLKILMRALTYEKGLQKQKKDLPMVVGVLFDPANSKSVLTSSAVVQTLEDQARQMKFMGRPIKISAIPLMDDPRMDVLIGKHLAALYVAPGIADKDVRRALKHTRQRSIISMSGTEHYIDLGVTLTVLVQDPRPRIIINEEAARAEDAMFSSRLLQLVEIRHKGHSHE